MRGISEYYERYFWVLLTVKSGNKQLLTNNITLTRYFIQGYHRHISNKRKIIPAPTAATTDSAGAVVADKDRSVEHCSCWKPCRNYDTAELDEVSE